MSGSEYDQPAIFTFSFFCSKDAHDEFTDLLNDIGATLEDRKLVNKQILLPQKEKLKIKYYDYSKKHPIRKYSEKWIDDGDRIAGVHPYTYLPFFLNSTGSVICRYCEGILMLDHILLKLNILFPSIKNYVLLRDLLAFLLLLEEMDLMEFKR